MSRAVRRRQSGTEQEGGVGDALRIATRGGHHRYLFQTALGWEPRARIDQVMKIAPPSPPHAAGGGALVAQHHGDAGESDPPAAAIPSRAARPQVAAEIPQRVSPQPSGEAVSHPPLGYATAIDAPAELQSRTPTLQGEHRW